VHYRLFSFLIFSLLATGSINLNYPWCAPYCFNSCWCRCEVLFDEKILHVRVQSSATSVLILYLVHIISNKYTETQHSRHNTTFTAHTERCVTQWSDWRDFM